MAASPLTYRFPWTWRIAAACAAGEFELRCAALHLAYRRLVGLALLLQLRVGRLQPQPHRPQLLLTLILIRIRRPPPPRLPRPAGVVAVPHHHRRQLPGPPAALRVWPDPLPRIRPPRPRRGVQGHV